MNPLRSVGARLSLALMVVVAAALGVVYLGVVPYLERNQIAAKVSELREEAPRVRKRVQLPDVFSNSPKLQRQDDRVQARVSILLYLGFGGMTTYADSRGGDSDFKSDRIALKAARLGRVVAGTVDRNGKRFAEAAAPYVPNHNYVLLLSAPLRDSLGSVGLVRRRILLAGLIALVASLGLGYGAATLFARRIRRLERAAETIASGNFEHPVVDHGRDELGQLAAAFERMRGRLAQLERARREFIANASHELRTPLFSLGGFLELLSDEEIDEETRREFLATMREQVTRLTRLATDLLDLSRLDAGRVRVELEPVDLREIVTTLCDEFRAVAQATGHTLEAGAREVVALADEERALQIGRMLVENGLVHTPSGTVIRVASEQRDGRAALVVADDGPGIPPEHAEQVFERFYRVEGSVASGSGLGLAIARELAGLMGGAVVLESAPGRTVVRVELPLDAAEAAFRRENVPVAAS